MPLSICAAIVSDTRAVCAQLERDILCVFAVQVFLSQLAHADSAGSLLPLLHAPLMEAKEEQLVLKGFNQNHKDYDTTTFVHSMFAQYAKRRPEAPCVIFEGCVYSYAHVSF